MNSLLESFFSLNNLPGHVAYLLLALSYYMTSMYWLRLVAVVALALEVFYFRLTGGDLAAGIAWSLVFILINLYQLYWLIMDRISLRLPEKEAPLLREALAGLNDRQIARLIKAAEWRDLPPGEVLTRQDAPIDSLFFLLSGRAHVDVNQKLITYLERGSFIGEIAYLTGNPATATVVVDEPARALVFNRMRMAKVIAADEEINGIVYQLLGRDLAMKMRRTNTRRVLLDEPTAI